MKNAAYLTINMNIYTDIYGKNISIVTIAFCTSEGANNANKCHTFRSKTQFKINSFDEYLYAKTEQIDGK